MKAVSRGWRIYLGRNPEREAQHLKKRFQKVSRRYERSIKARQYVRLAGMALVAAGLSFTLSWGMLSLSPWPPLLTLKHLAALPSCAMARVVGLAPAYRGTPGYWSWHDSNGDGRSCS